MGAGRKKLDFGRSPGRALPRRRARGPEITDQRLDEARLQRTVSSCFFRSTPGLVSVPAVSLSSGNDP
jgi:hypothetical protein